MLVEMLAMLAMAQAPPAKPPLPLLPAPAVVPRSADGTVLGAIGAADANEIEAATLASKKGNSSEVRGYATMLLHAHERSLTATANLAKQFKVTRLLPADSAMARFHAAEMLDLNAQSGDAFDHTFVSQMVASHKTGIEKAKGTLLPMAVRAQVKAFVRARIPALLLHQQAGEKWLAAHP